MVGIMLLFYLVEKNVPYFGTLGSLGTFLFIVI